MNDLMISDTAIRTDESGRYCLNDLHRSAGGEKRHQPSDWLRTKQTQDLIVELSVPGIPGTPQSSPVEVFQGGVAQGTFVAKELVYAYAMWISPAFHLQVIRTFDKVAAQATPTPTMLMTPAAIAASTIREVMSIAREFAVPLDHALSQAAQAADLEGGTQLWSTVLSQAKCMVAISAADRRLEPKDLGTVFGLSGAEMNHWLAEHGLQTKVNGQWTATPAGEAMSVLHKWSTAYKSGYNLMWNVSQVTELWQRAH